MKIAVLDAGTLGSDLSMAPLFPLGEVVSYESTAPHEMDERVADADVIVVNKVRCNENTLAAARKLRLICLAATGYDNVDVAYCRSRGIGVCNVVGYSTDSVAQLTVSMALALSVNLLPYGAYVSDGRYTQSGRANAVSPVYHELAGKTWGIFGYGNIGKKVARIAEAIGCRVIVCKRTPTEEAYPVVSFDTLCRESDVLTLHSPLNEGTRGIFDKEHLAMMKKGAILVNVARGAVLDEAAVAEALLNGDLGGFGCDVYTSEPFGEDHPYTSILSQKNVILTPHMAWGAYEARARCLDEIAENIRVFTRGGVRNRVDLDK